jgi:hypothetical protein
MLVTNDADRPSGSGSNPKLVLFAVSFNDICPSLAHCSFASAVSSPQCDTHRERRSAARLRMKISAPRGSQKNLHIF